MTLRTRLALISAGSLAVVFLVVAVALYALYARSATQTLDRGLEQQVRALSDGPPGDGPGRDGPPRIGDLFRGRGGGERGDEVGSFGLPLRVARRELLAQLVNRRGEVVVTSEPLQELGTLEVDAGTRAVARTGERRFRSGEIGSTEVRVLETPVRRGVLQVAVPRDDLDASLARLARLLWLLGLVGVAAAAAAGWWLAGRALRPIHALTATAHEIERTRDLSRRVPGAGMRDELGELARTFNAMLDAVDALQQAQRRFAADASHELRTPLTSLAGNIEYLARADVDAADRSAAVADVRADVERLTRLAGDLLVLARGDARTSMPRAPIELGAVLQAACDRAARQAPGHTITCQVVEAPMLADGDALERMVVNLLDNAVRHTPPGSCVQATLARNGTCVELAVADDGPGMQPEDAARAFDRFHRGAGASAVEGSGLGLAIVRQAARAHGGDATVEAAPGAGCTVTVRLPHSSTPDPS